MPATTYYKKLVLDHGLLQVNYSTSWYVGFWTADPTSAGLLTGEFTAGDYTRKLVAWDSTWANSAEIYWDAAGSDWGTATYVCLCNTPTKGTGNMLLYQSRSPLVVDAGTPVSIPIGGLTVDVT
jgi:hypothetical protein